MIDIAIQELHKYYGANHVLQGVSLEIYSGEKVGLLGKNGSGKTTLFKTLTGDEHYESGSISKASGKRVEMLVQIPAFGDEDTSEDILRSSFAEVTDIYNAMKKIEGDADPVVLARYGRLMEEYERLGGYDTEVRLDKICGGMQIDRRLRNSPFHLLSGGEKARVNLARILLRECDILLLDEPTNHLDIASLEWLEKFLRDFPGTVVAISHDRVFLDRVVTRIVEIEAGKTNFYAGNYSFYIEEKRRRFTFQSQQYERQQKEIKRIQDRAKWFVEQDRFTTKHHAILSRIDHMDMVEKPITSSRLTAGFNSGGHASKEIVALDALRKRYGEKVVMDDVSLSMLRNDRIALVGENGCGKSTLLKMLMNEEQPDSGDVKISPNAKVAYMPQIIAFEDGEATVLDTLRWQADLSQEKARGILAGFHFMAADVTKKVNSLSGGEKSRLKLCMMMQENINFLLLDEPTNHLDIASREWIENALEDFEGTMLFVSHDRYFLNKFADKVWSMEGGAITPYDCGFEAYNASLRKETVPQEKPKKGKAQTAPPKPAAIPIEAQIMEAEAELERVSAEIEADVSKADFSRMDALYGEKKRIQERVDALYAAWQKGGYRT